MVDTVEIMLQYGLYGVAIVIIYYFIQLYKRQTSFIQEKLIDVIQNNTKALEQLIIIVNHMRHELLQSTEKLENLIRRNLDVLEQISKKIK